MEEPDAKRRKTIHDETESEVVPSYGLVLEKVGQYLTKDNVEALATIAELTPSEKDQVMSRAGNGSRILFKILEQNQIIGRHDVRWLQRNLRQIKNEMAAKIIDDFISSTEEKCELPSEPEYSEGEDEDEDDETTFDKFLEKVGLKDKYPDKLKLKTFLQLVTNEESNYAHIFWQKLTTLHCRAGILQEIISQDYSMRDFIFSVLHCCDGFLRQDILEKMSTCQLAIPLVLQGVAHSKPTFLLWAVRRIIKRWRGESDSFVIEQPIVNYPVFNTSFLRIGDVRLSKSQLMNTMLSYSQGYSSHTFFLNREIDIVMPRFSPGTVECVWFLPMRESENQIFKEVTAFLNLRGDCTKYPAQTTFACKAAHLTVALITTSKHNSYKQCISQIKKNSKSTLFISISEDESRGTTSQKVHRPKYKDGCLFVNVVHTNILCKTICDEIVSKCKLSSTAKLRLESLVDFCGEDIETDEQKDLCREARLTVNEIFEAEKDKTELGVLDFKENSFPLQSVWKDWVEIDKAPLQIETEVHETFEHQMESKRMKKREKRELQLGKNLSMTMETYLRKIQSAKSNSALLQYIFGFMQEKIYHMVNEDTRNDLIDIAELEREIRKLRDRMMTGSKGKDDSEHDEQGTSEGRIESILKLKLNECNKLYRNCRAKHLGGEHFLRELGQLYEAWLDLQDVHASRLEGSNTLNVALLPSLAAGLVTEMQSLEIMDGDTGYVPLKWVTSVLDTLTWTLGDPKVLVLSVIGVQSSGKSTLLNSMFGVRFPVRAGRCTRGLFIQLLKLSDRLSEELGFQYLVIVDSEGIRSIDYVDRKFDNKLVTLALSIANVTIFNIEGENIGPDKTGILQIAAHALMRMKEVDLECHCRIVQQRVSDMTAGDRNKTNTKKIQEILDEATRFAAEEEGLDERYKQFSDVVDLQFDEDLQYIPCLWAGGMAPPNHLYSETISKLKDKLFEDIKRGYILGKLTLSTFTDRVRDVWKAIKEEDFVFNFHDSVKAVDYNKFLLEYNQWIAQMRQDVQVKIVEVLSSVHAEPQTEVLLPNITVLKESLKSELEQQRTKLTMCVKNHIENHPRKGTMMRYRQEFLHDINVVLNETEDHSLTKISDEYEIKRISFNLPRFEQKSLEILTREAKAEARKVTDAPACLKSDHFDVIWKKMIDKLRSDHNITPVMVTTSSLQNICEKLLLKVTRDMAIGSEMQALLSQEGGITNHLSLEDCAKYIGAKFVKSWLLHETSTKAETIGNRFGEFRNASGKANASRTTRGGNTQNKPEKHLEEQKRQQAVTYLRKIVEEKLSHLRERSRSKAFDANVFQIMLRSTLKELSTKHLTYNIKLPHRLIAKGLLSFCGRSVAEIYESGDGDIENYLGCLRYLVENTYSSFINHQNQDDAATEFILYYTAKIMDDKIISFREKVYSNVDHTQYAKHMHIPWDILRFVFTPYTFIEVYGFYDELLTAPLHDIVDLYVDSKREKCGKQIIERGKEGKIATYITDLVGKIQKLLSQATRWNEWCKLLGNFLSCPFIESAGDLFRVTDLSVVTGKLLDDLRLCYEERYGTFESFYNSSFKNAVGLSYVCNEVCPMCGAWCDNILQSHTVHSSFLHRPRGLKGEKYPFNKSTRIDFISDPVSDSQSSRNSNLHGERYVQEDCPMSLTSDTATFEYEGKMVLCKDYKKLFPNWDIQPGKGNASNKLFWQYFFVRHHSGSACNIPQSWLDITPEEAIQSLEWAKDAQLEKRKSMASIPL